MRPKKLGAATRGAKLGAARGGAGLTRDLTTFAAARVAIAAGETLIAVRSSVGAARVRSAAGV